jgi:hypothetical protein
MFRELIGLRFGCLIHRLILYRCRSSDGLIRMLDGRSILVAYSDVLREPVSFLGAAACTVCNVSCASRTTDTHWGFVAPVDRRCMVEKELLVGRAHFNGCF